MFPSQATYVCSPLPSSGYRGRSLRKPCGSPPSLVLRAHKTARPSFQSPPVSLGGQLLSAREDASSPGFLENPFGSMPRARDSGDPGTTSRYRSTECCLPLCQQRRRRNQPIFGAESSWPASLLCTLRTHPSAGEWQHSLAACSLARSRDRAEARPLSP